MFLCVVRFGLNPPASYSKGLVGKKAFAIGKKWLTMLTIRPFPELKKKEVVIIFTVWERETKSGKSADWRVKIPVNPWRARLGGLRRGKKCLTLTDFAGWQNYPLD